MKTLGFKLILRFITTLLDAYLVTLRTENSAKRNIVFWIKEFGEHLQIYTLSSYPLYLI